MKKEFILWGIRPRGRHHVFCAFEKSHHAQSKCEELRKEGVVCKIVKLSAHIVEDE